MDGTLNEYDGLDVEGFPSIIFFKGGELTPEDKFKGRKVYEGERNVGSLIEFLKNNTFHGIHDIITLPNEAQIEAQENEEAKELDD